MATSGERRGKGGGADIGLLERDTGLRNGGERAEDATEGGDERHRRTYDKYRQPLSMMVQSEEDYCKKLPRNRRKNRSCLGFSCPSWLFLVLAFLQATLVVGFQIAITLFGDFRKGRLEEYVSCFERSIGYPNGTLPANITFPTFGRDKEIYVYFFISLELYNFCLCVYALKVKNIVEVYMFLVINILAIGYAGVQVYQFRGFGDECDPITTVGYLALANALVLILFTVIFMVMSLFIYVEFGWKIYTRVGCDSDLRYYYRVYEVFMSGVKLLILFMLIFFIGQCTLLLFVDKHNINYEFWIVVFLLIPITFAVYPFTYWTVRRENVIGSIVLVIIDLLVIAYTIYKIVRFATLSCPLCKEQVRDIEREADIIQELLNTTSTDVRENLNRIEEFENLILLGVINLVIAVLELLVFIHLLRQYGKGLKEYFASQRSGRDWWPFRNRRKQYEVSLQPQKGKFLNLTNRWNAAARKKSPSNDVNSSRRDSDLAVTRNPSKPSFFDAEPTVAKQPVGKSRGRH